MRVQIDGTIVAPSDPHIWDPNSPRTWLVFNKLNSFIIQGDGVIEGNGGEWWGESCKRKQAFTIDSSSSVEMSGLTIRNGQQMNVIITHSKYVLLSNVTVSAPASSPNTDGIHLTSSTNVVLQNCTIGTGDDCISIVDGCSDIKMTNISCGPGHGISIGSLGQNNSTGKVQRVVLDTAYLKDTTNGLRIKTYQGGSGYVKSVSFQNVQMDNVSNPIIINQFYCDSPKKCRIQVKKSAVNISQITYSNVTGISQTKEAMTFACSDTVPCTDIILSNICLHNKDGTAETYCNSASGITKGFVQPPADCLLSSDKAKIMENEEEITGEEHVIHTEL
ncbi:probable polygalacturonase at1g80170 [Phtheirospermum japonicum]|uniref:Probable polygalacturonase at1g80170 n=1 Tax=Phtheirospermum japonicum TaxID=374723 RepID=A0A830B395_9LAMI|nr:probable polygalacturonase at1g80170 [Phtheirospermum japonicum]